MKLHIFPASGRVVGIVALNHYLGLDCDIVPIDLSRGEQRTPEYIAINANRKMPTLEDDGIALWESNAILYYMASKRPDSGLWPTDTKSQSDVLRWLFWESAHWDAESVGMVAFEKASKSVLGLGPPDTAFITRGEQNFSRFADVLNESLKGRTWVTGDRLTIADFSIGGFLPTADRMALPLEHFPEIGRWYDGLASMPAWKVALAERKAALELWFASKTVRKPSSRSEVCAVESYLLGDDIVR